MARVLSLLPTGQTHRSPTLKIGSSMSWQKVRGSFFPSGLFADLLNLPLAGSKYLGEEQVMLQLNAQSLALSGVAHAQYTLTLTCLPKVSSSYPPLFWPVRLAPVGPHPWLQIWLHTSLRTALK